MKKLLIANRGEIALRIIRAAREHGMSPVAIYSDVDRDALHVRLADEAFPLGGSTPAESYLNIEKIVAIAKRAKVFAVHPGYGFLAENAAFARACEKAKLVFIGPSSRVIASMGDKIEARARAKKAGVRMVSASPSLPSFAIARNAAKKIGYPVLLKARAGGGGKGMRAVRAEGELQAAFELAQSEAKKAFGDPTLYMERFVLRPRHIEVQIFADEGGNVLALGDRECSIQRRHQKIIEEAPAPNLSDQTRAMMASAARDIARAVKYRGAGTVEFLVDAKESFYFLEMNTRLQVEHPVTEWTTGLDLVGWQIEVASGRSLPLLQNQVVLVGHSIEVRLYAEDPDNNFFPAPGTIKHLHWPAGPGVRIDSGVETGSEISLFYDPLIAKISVWGENRGHAVRRMQRALSEIRIGGVKTNLAFLQAIVDHPRFQKGRLTTTFIQEEGPFDATEPDELTLNAALATVALELSPKEEPGTSSPLRNPWWASGLPRSRTFSRP